MERRIVNENITELQPNEIFVFGSNLGGRHGAGAAKLAMRWGAEYGNPVGLQGQTYAIPTLNELFQPLSIAVIQEYITEFIEFAIENPTLTFFVTQIGCGIAGFETSEIGPLFHKALEVENIYLPEIFILEIENPYIFFT